MSSHLSVGDIYNSIKSKGSGVTDKVREHGRHDRRHVGQVGQGALKNGPLGAGNHDVRAAEAGDQTLKNIKINDKYL